MEHLTPTYNDYTWERLRLHFYDASSAERIALGQLTPGEIDRANALSEDKKPPANPPSSVVPSIKSYEKKDNPVQIVSKAQEKHIQTPDHFGYHLMLARATYKSEAHPLGLTEEQLAHKVNTESNAALTSQDIVHWQRNENIEWLQKEPEMFQALAHVLITTNDAVHANQKASTIASLKRSLDETIESQKLPADQRDPLKSNVFATSLSILRPTHMSEQELADAVNARLTVIEQQNRPTITALDIVDYQAGVKVPDQQTIVRLGGALGIDLAASQELNKAAKTQIQWSDQKKIYDDFHEKAEATVLAPLRSLMEQNHIPLLSAKYGLEKGVALGRGQGFKEEDAIGLMNGWRKEAQDRIHLIPPGENRTAGEALINKWEKLSEEYIKAMKAGPHKSAESSR